MDVNTIVGLFDSLEQRYPSAPVVCAKENGTWREYKVEEFTNNVNALSFGLIKLGIGKDDKIANMSFNRPEWNFVDYAIAQIGAIHIPLYPTLAEQDIRFILNDAEVKVIFVSTKEIYNQIIKLKADIPSLQAIYTYDTIPEARSWKELCCDKSEIDYTEIDLRKSRIDENDVLTIIYTSGTTGTPKGVMLSHKNIMSNIRALHSFIPRGVKRSLSFLPLSHVFERVAGYLCIDLGITIYYAESIETISANLQEVKPHFFTTVPRLLEKIYDKITIKGSELTGIKKALFYWALNLGLKYELNGANGWWYETQLKLANKLIFSKWREALGGEVKLIVSGGAALQTRLAKVFMSAGITVLEGYGLTETSPVIAANHFDPKNYKFNFVGKPIKGIEVKIAEDGEILCKGPNVFLGYYKRPDLTEKAIDQNGWFHTEDIGEIDSQGFLRITDRKKEMFKTAGGKYVAPQAIENKLKESLLIEQVLVIGENQRFPSALIVPAFENLREWCSRHAINYTTNSEIIKHSEVLAKFKREVEKYNKEFGKWEQVKKFELLPKEWTIDGGEMTPKLSLKRKVIVTNNNELIDKIYAHQ
ncbi:long-chain fatty acid--CoA ligase [Solitalea longa]|uniref:Long-chain fatty acid--CoA ligase n=1 Tax=Solitalea longa TaxID=2079460 RepID=A0A2S4ZZL0_9SPHI|nr:AMP-dependent synthetase/ligase [Solitalea longa]POY35781.1 long-chain fatty acid--CoA ligase [Solitalea longa]